MFFLIRWWWSFGKTVKPIFLLNQLFHVSKSWSQFQATKLSFAYGWTFHSKDSDQNPLARVNLANLCCKLSTSLCRLSSTLIRKTPGFDEPHWTNQQEWRKHVRIETQPSFSVTVEVKPKCERSNLVVARQQGDGHKHDNGHFFQMVDFLNMKRKGINKQTAQNGHPPHRAARQ